MVRKVVLAVRLVRCVSCASEIADYELSRRLVKADKTGGVLNPVVRSAANGPRYTTPIGKAAEIGDGLV